MIITHSIDGKGDKGEKAEKGEKKTVRTMIIKDGVVVSENGDKAGVMMLDSSAAGDMVKVMETAGGKKMVMIRHHQMADQAGKLAALAGSQVEVGIAEVTARLRTRCEENGIKMPADADLGKLATCGMEIQNKQREAMEAARAAIAASRDLSAEQRTAALKGLDAAIAGQGMASLFRLEKLEK